MDQDTSFPHADFLDAAKRGVKIRFEHDLAAEAAALGDAKGTGAFFHDHLGTRAHRARGKCGGDRVIAGADRADAAPALVLVERERVHERTARLEAAGVLEQLELEEYARARREGGVGSRPLERHDRGLENPVAKPGARRADFRKRQPGSRGVVVRHGPGILADRLQSAACRSAKTLRRALLFSPREARHTGPDKRLD